MNFGTGTAPSAARPFNAAVVSPNVWAVQRAVETAFRHRRLIGIPILVSLLVALAFGAVQPKTYASGSTVWFDVATTAAIPSSVPVGAETGAASEEVAIIKEFLSTQQFVHAVATRGPLESYLASHSNWQTGWAAFPGLAKVFGNASQPPDVRAADAIAKGVAVTSSGPQVVAITFNGPTAAVAQGTVKAILDQFSDQVLSTRRAQAQSAVTTQSTVVDNAQQAVARAQSELGAYEAAHPQASLANDTQLASLETAVGLVTDRYQNEVVTMDKVTTDLAEVGQNAGFHVIDQPTSAGSPAGRSKQLLLATIAGLLVGLALSGALVFILTALDRTARRPEDLQRALGLLVIGSVPLAGHSGRTPHGRRRFFAVASDRRPA